MSDRGRIRQRRRDIRHRLNPRVFRKPSAKRFFAISRVIRKLAVDVREHLERQYVICVDCGDAPRVLDRTRVVETGVPGQAQFTAHFRPDLYKVGRLTYLCPRCFFRRGVFRDIFPETITEKLRFTGGKRGLL